MISTVHGPRAVVKLTQIHVAAACSWTSGSFKLNLPSPLLLSAHQLQRRNRDRRWETTSAVRVNHNTKVNPPVSTLPAPLVLQEREPDEKLISYAFKLGKGYLNFYKTGLKAVFTNFRSTQEKLDRLAISGRAPSLADAARNNRITRSEYHFVRRARRDVSKLPMFALVFFVCGEFTPLVVVFMSGVVPWPCRIPKQVLRERRGMEERRGISFRGLVEGPPAAESLKRERLEALSPPQVLHVGRSLGLYSKLWPEGLVGTPPLLGWLIKGRIEQRLDYLDLDDFMITRDGGVDEMEMEEVTMALVERGVDTLGRSDSQLKETLRDWLRAKRSLPTLQLLLTRPSVWQKRKE